MTDTDRLRVVLDLAQAGLDDPDAGAGELAGRAHLSRFHFDRIVAAAAGEPPGALRRRLLLERAAYRLISGRGSVVEVAIEAGYGSHEAFTRAFGRAYGRSPRALRADPPPTLGELELPAPSGVHFQPPGGLRLPAPRKVTSMDVLLHLTRHHVDALTSLLEHAGELPDDALDRPIELSVEGLDDAATLRSTLNAMVTQEEHWLSALRGGSWADESDTSVPGMLARHRLAGPAWVAFVESSLDRGTLGDTFVDTTCDPPMTTTIAGTIAHVATFAAVRRTTAVGALWSLGRQHMELADPRPALDRILQAT